MVWQLHEMLASPCRKICTAIPEMPFSHIMPQSCVNASRYRGFYKTYKVQVFIIIKFSPLLRFYCCHDPNAFLTDEVQ
jgi:hypothetical protein